jgi:hypothetical protein
VLVAVVLLGGCGDYPDIGALDDWPDHTPRTSALRC